MENCDQIHYLDCPHFTVGRVDQWFEQGYLLFQDKVYWYDVDRKDQCENANSPMAVEEFLEYARERQLSIPEDFMEQLKGSNK